jgi:tRNA threonylcarbamoyladenosine modification (KEOPS) complex  Pcc1 subunit
MVKAEKAAAAVEFSFKNPREAEAVLQAIKPEEELPPSAKCKASIERKKSVLCLRVEAEDTAALRAALNSFIRWTMVARDMVGKGK